MYQGLRDAEDRNALPNRLFMEDPKTTWRDGSKPQFTTTDGTYMKERTQRHSKESLEKKVEDLVKTFVMEITYKTDMKDWKTMDIPNFRFHVNGHTSFTAQDLFKVGAFNAVLCDHHIHEMDEKGVLEREYDSAFPRGFPFEVLEIQSGLPTISFTWRHWANWTKPFRSQKPNGKTINVYGSCVATVTKDLKFKDVQIYYDPTEFLVTLNGADGLKCPHLGGVKKSQG